MGLEAVTIVYGNKKTILDAAVIAENNVVIADAVTAYDDAVKILTDAITTATNNNIAFANVNNFFTAANTFKDAIKNTFNTNNAIDEYISAADNLIAEIIIEVGGNVPQDYEYTDYNGTKTTLQDSVTKYETTVTTTLVNISTYDIAAGTIRTLIENADKAEPKNSIPISDVRTFLTAANTLKGTATVAAAVGSEPVTRQQINTNLNNYFTATITYIEKIISDKINEKDGTIAEKDGKINSADNTNNKLIAIKVAINELESKTMINDRVGHNFIQDKVISQYTNNILFFLYYVIFILFAVSLYLNRESYSTFLIVIILLIFGVLPFIIKYITNFAYNRFLDIAHIFYNGNARYLGPKAMPQ